MTVEAAKAEVDNKIPALLTKIDHEHMLFEQYKDEHALALQKVLAFVKLFLGRSQLNGTCKRLAGFSGHDGTRLVSTSKVLV